MKDYFMFIIILFSSSWKELDVDADGIEEKSLLLSHTKTEHDQCKKIPIVVIFVLANLTNICI